MKKNWILSSKKSVCCVVAGLLLSSLLNSQPLLPPFKMYRSDSSIFSATALPKNKAVVVIYFDPECDHCQKIITEIFKKINSFKKTEMVMVTFKPVADIAAFEKKYKIRNYSNVTVGTEGTSFQLRDYYKIEKLPFTALYDKGQKLIYHYGQEISVDDLIQRLKKLD
jgi:thiol-disulfide isomerase/thioredoxin